MTRRYGAALEEITGEAIRQHPRDGRQYRADQVDALLRAKGYLEANPRLSVPQALRLALGGVPAVATLTLTHEAGTAAQALAEALERSLLPELRALREEVAGMRAEAREREARETEHRTALPPAQAVDDTPTDSGGEGGVFVRAARWLERLLRI